MQFGYCHKRLAISSFKCFNNVMEYLLLAFFFHCQGKSWTLYQWCSKLTNHNVLDRLSVWSFHRGYNNDSLLSWELIWFRIIMGGFTNQLSYIPTQNLLFKVQNYRCVVVSYEQTLHQFILHFCYVFWCNSLIRVTKVFSTIRVGTIIYLMSVYH